MVATALLQDGRQVCDLCKRGQQVRLDGLSFPVTISWLYLKRDGFPRETICPLHSAPQGQYHHLVGETPPLQLKDSLKPANIALVYIDLVRVPSWGCIVGLCCP